MKVAAIPSAKRKKPSFFFVMAVVAILVAFIGFSKTFFISVGKGTFTAPWTVHVHGAFAFMWIILFLVQSSLIQFKKYHIHKMLGVFGIFVAAGVFITLVPVGLFAVKKELGLGLGITAYSGFVGVLTSGLMFFSLVVLGVYYRKKPKVHKRLMLLATIVVLWPAWFRFRHFFPNIPNPEIWFALVLADSLIIVALIWDKLRNGKVHPILLYIGLFIILEQTFEVLAFDSAPWRKLALWLHTIFT